MKNNNWQLNLGASKGSFALWAPLHDKVFVEIRGKGLFPMEKGEKGYFHLTTDKAEVGDLYYYQFANGMKRYDPVSRFLPEGIDGPTQIIDKDGYHWHDEKWLGIAFEEYIFYEIHVGTFTEEGNYQGLLKKILYLKSLGITCIELMPLAHFPGRCNWGYDGVSLFAPYSGYGSVDDLKALIDACHQEGIAVCLDVVYNHLGCINNYLAEFAPYFNIKDNTPWGNSLNYDGAFSDEVRFMVISNALYWMEEYHIDALRLDAIQHIYDSTAFHFLQELSEAVASFRERSGRKVYLITESDRNDTLIVRTKEEGGYEMEALWNDDFHHSFHTFLTEERGRYYEDFSGAKDLVKALSQGFVYDNQYSSFRGFHYGNSCKGVALNKFVVFVQNHDQVGNHPFGERLSTLLIPTLYKLLPFFLLMTPGTPLLFMGEEYGEERSFGYFVDFEETDFIRVVEGRKREYGIEYMHSPSLTVFEDSKLSWKIKSEIHLLYTKLIALRKEYRAKSMVMEDGAILVYYDEENKVLAWEYETVHSFWVGIFCYFGKKSLNQYQLPLVKVKGELLLASSSQITVEKRGVISANEEAAALLI